MLISIYNGSLPKELIPTWKGLARRLPPRFRSRLGRAPLRETQHLGTMLGLASLDPIYERTPAAEMSRGLRHALQKHRQPPLVGVHGAVALGIVHGGDVQLARP